MIFAGVAQLVERNLAKVEVESSRLFSRSNFKTGSLGFPFLSEGTNLLIGFIISDDVADRSILAR